LDVFFMKKALWYSWLDSKDQIERPILFRALIDANGAGSEKVKNAILRTLKDKSDETVNGTSISAFLMMHMIASSYLEGLLSVDRKQALWQIYPGHSRTSTPPPLIQAAIRGFKIFRSKAADDAYGLTRWQNALQSHLLRQGSGKEKEQVRFINQVNSVCIAKGTNVEAKRVIVLDDFCTKGFSLEAARNLYFSAGAESVSTFAFGRYGKQYVEVSPQQKKTIKPYAHAEYDETDFHQVWTTTNTDDAALTEFTKSLTRIKGSSIGAKLLS